MHDYLVDVKPAFDPSVYEKIYRRRFIDPEANPRRQQKHKKPVIVLFHYTSPKFLKPILRDGLVMGDVPVRWQPEPSSECFNNATWLTERSIASEQTWGQAQKRQIRLTIEIPATDMNLWQWRDLARHLDMAPEWYGELNRRGSGYADKWWVYCNEPIPPNRIVRIERLKVPWA